MKYVYAAALLAGATLAHAQPASAPAAAASAPVSAAKKELAAKAVALQQPFFDSIAGEILMGPVMRLGQAARNSLQSLPPEKRDSAIKSIDADIRKFLDESMPLMRERAAKIAPTTVGPLLEERMSEDELRQLNTWLSSPAAKKYQQLGGEVQQALAQKLAADAGPLLTPKLQALEQKVRVTLGVPAPDAPASGAKPPAAAAKPPAKPASK